MTPRIALVSGGLALGGSTTFLCNLAGELVRRQIPTEVHSFEKLNPLAADFARLNIPVVCQDETRLIFEDRLSAIVENLRQFKPNVVLANLSAMSFEVLRYVPRGVFRVGVSHADHPGVYQMIRCYPEHLDLMAVVSETIKQKLKLMPEFSAVPVKYLPLGVPMPEQLIPRQFTGPLRILYLGRLAREQKRVHLFPEILAKIRASGIPFRWTIAGEGPEADWLQSTLAASNPAGASDVSLQGPVSYAGVPRLLAEHNVFLLASDYEGLPLGLLEAMGSGMVPVVSDLPSGIRELVDEETGKRVAPGNAVGYADAIVWLHEHREDMAHLSANARNKVLRGYSISAMTDRWLGAFSPSSTIAEWSPARSILPPLASPSSFQFSPLARVLRRLRLKFRNSAPAARLK